MKFFLASLALLATAGSSFATTFIVPDDEELIRKSKGIVTGIVVSASADVRENGDLETRYEIALDRVFKGPFQPGTIIPIQSPGGMTEDRWTIVEGSAQFRVGDEVILFLTPYRGGWTPTDLTLGKFRLALTSAGYSVAVRDEDDIEGWDRDGEVHKEKIRLAGPFMSFIEDAVARRTPADRAYEIEAGEVLAAPPAAGPRPVGEAQPRAELFPAPSHTYSSGFYDCSLTRFPARWQTTTMNAGISWRKSSAQNASGLADGGVSVIQTALAAWTNDCGSSVNIVYAGTTPNLKNSNDGINAIVFNDPGGHVPGSWTGSGTIAITFSSGGANHSFDNTTWVTITDSDVIFQDGYAGTQPSIEEAMTHEIGHGIGFRHSDKHYLKTCTAPDCVISCSETACQSSVEDCASTAIMTATVNSSLGYTLQTWDKNAADALYPGTCTGVTAPANVVATATSTSTVNVSWAAATGAASYNVYRSTDGTNYALAGSTSGTSLNDSGRTANTAYLYKVRAVSGAESGDSNRDLATTVIFTDDPLVPGSTRVKAVHITQLRTAVNAVRTLASLGPGSYTDPTLTAGVTVKAAHVNDPRTALNAARSSLSLPAVSYAETITPRVTKIKASHLTELRNGVK